MNFLIFVLIFGFFSLGVFLYFFLKRLEEKKEEAGGVFVEKE